MIEDFFSKDELATLENQIVEMVHDEVADAWVRLLALADEGEVAKPTIEPFRFGFVINCACREHHGQRLSVALDRTIHFMQGWVARMEYDRENRT